MYRDDAVRAVALHGHGGEVEQLWLAAVHVDGDDREPTALLDPCVRDLVEQRWRDDALEALAQWMGARHGVPGQRSEDGPAPVDPLGRQREQLLADLLVVLRAEECMRDEHGASRDADRDVEARPRHPAIARRLRPAVQEADAESAPGTARGQRKDVDLVRDLCSGGHSQRGPDVLAGRALHGSLRHAA